MLSFHGFELNSKDPVYIQLALYVKRKILLKETFSGDKIPSRREIALQLGMNPNTVQKAFKLMEEEGYVRTVSTQGSEIHVDALIWNHIEKELTYEMIHTFIRSAKDLNLSFKQVMDLISDHWGAD